MWSRARRARRPRTSKRSERLSATDGFRERVSWKPFSLVRSAVTEAAGAQNAALLGGHKLLRHGQIVGDVRIAKFVRLLCLTAPREAVPFPRVAIQTVDGSPVNSAEFVRLNGPPKYAPAPRGWLLMADGYGAGLPNAKAPWGIDHGASFLYVSDSRPLNNRSTVDQTAGAARRCGGGVGRSAGARPDVSWPPRSGVRLIWTESPPGRAAGPRRSPSTHSRACRRAS